jgi:outer membrane protein assembly factor BamB
MAPTIAFAQGNKAMKAGAAAAAAIGLVLAAGCGSSSTASRDEVQVHAAPVVATPAPAKQQRLLKDTPFERSWDLQLPGQVRSSWISQNIPDLVFFEMQENHEVYAVDAFSGNTRWVSPPFPKVLRLAPAVTRNKVRDSKGSTEGAADDRLWAISDDTLYSLDAIYGQIVWRFQLPFSPSTGPLPLGPDSNQRIFIGDWGGRLEVVTLEPNRRRPYILWQMNLRNPLTAALAESDGLVYAADHSGTVHCFKYDREEIWQYNTGSVIYGAPLARGRVLFVGNDDNVLYALNRLTGERLGSLYLNGPIQQAPFAFKAEPARVYVWLNDHDPKIGGLYAIKTQNDNIPFADTTKHPLEVERLGIDWFASGIDHLVASTPDYLFGTSGGSSVVYAINRGTGHVDWSWDVNEQHRLYRNEQGKVEPRNVAFISEYQDPSDLNRSIYTIDDTGHVIAYRVYGDKPGDPLSGDRVRIKSTKPAAAPADADAKPAADKPAADAAKPAAKPAADAAPAAAPTK